MKIILLSLAIGRCATAKSIEGSPVGNKIERGNLANGYFIEQSSRDIIKEKIDEETIQAFDCMEESMASAEISLNPPSECKREDGSAYKKNHHEACSSSGEGKANPRQHHLLHDPLTGQCRLVWRGIRHRELYAQ